MPLSTTATGLLNTSRDGYSTASLGNLFQCLSSLFTLSMKKIFLTSNLKLSWGNLGSFPRILMMINCSGIPLACEVSSCLPRRTSLRAHEKQAHQKVVGRLSSTRSREHTQIDFNFNVNSQCLHQGGKLQNNYYRPQCCLVLNKGNKGCMLERGKCPLNYCTDRN